MNKNEAGRLKYKFMHYVSNESKGYYQLLQPIQDFKCILIKLNCVFITTKYRQGLF